MLFIGIQTHGMIGRNAFVYCVIMIVNRPPHGSYGSFMLSEIERKSDISFDLCRFSMSNIKLDSLWTNLKATSIFIARKRCLGQGNDFTRTCHSVHRWEGVSVWLCLDRDCPGKETLLDRDLPVR